MPAPGGSNVGCTGPERLTPARTAAPLAVIHPSLASLPGPLSRSLASTPVRYPGQWPAEAHSIRIRRPTAKGCRSGLAIVTRPGYIPNYLSAAGSASHRKRAW